jgi:hypothetical protein
LALFDPRGQTGYPGSLDIAVDKNTGVIYAADGYNHRIRKIYKNSGQWTVSTYAGGGGTVMQMGHDYAATDVNLDVYVALTVDDTGNVWTSSAGNLVRIAPGAPPKARIMAFANNGLLGDIVDMDCDSLGNIYCVVRGVLNCIVKYSTDGTLTQLTGTSNPRTWDGQAGTATFNCPSYIAVSRDGTAIYVGGGDETTIRRIKNGRVSSFQENGTWVEKPDLADGMSNLNGWQVGAPRLVDQNGYLYIAWSLHLPRPLRKLLPQ